MSAEQLGRFCKSRSFSPWKKRCWATISRTSATKTLPWDIINPASIALVLREFMAVVLMTSSSAQRTLTFWKAQRGWDVAREEFGRGRLPEHASPPWAEPSMADGLLEVVAVRGVLQLGLAQMSLTGATRLAQCSCLSISSTVPLPVQVTNKPNRGFHSDSWLPSA